MKILLYSNVFLPSLGGIEIVSATLAEHLVTLGHDCTVVTETASESEDHYAFKVNRKPSLFQRLTLVREHDIVHSNGASMALFFHAKVLGKPFVWTHGGYQLSCVDGLGWVDGIRAPLTPLQSLRFHYYRKGIVFVFREAIKLVLRRWVGKRVNANIAVTQWVASRQPLLRQSVIYNPFPLDKFSKVKHSEQIYDFIYVGRIVSEKGLPDLLKAFALVLKRHEKATLAIVGDGNWKDKVVELSRDAGISSNTFFMGRKTGEALLDVIAQSKIAVVPSVWEEPMGGVALEMLAAGKNVIVSRNGGMSECVGNAGLTFENGNHEELSSRMLQLYEAPDLQQSLKTRALDQLRKFDPLMLTHQYIKLYQQVFK